jgi:putative transposase
MGRMARVVVPGVPHHITQRGVRSMRIFFAPEDRIEYLQLLHDQSQSHGLHYASYTLMDNHIHLIAIPEREDSLRKAIGEAHRLYTRGINLRMRKRGYLFQGRPFSCPLDDEHFSAALRYVERNPARAKMVALPWDYPWSGAPYHVGLMDTDPLIDVDCLALCHLSPKEWRQFLLADPPEMGIIQKRTQTGRPCGSKAFIEQLEALTGRILHPRRPGPCPKADFRGKYDSRQCLRGT